MKILFISNVDIVNRRGGWDGLGGKMYDLLSREYEEVKLVEKINPPVPFWSKASSKFLRLAGLPAGFPAFSKDRLKKFAAAIPASIGEDIGSIFFHGSTPWVDYRSPKKYFVYIDCCFLTYMQVYHRVGQYSKKQVRRIVDKERKFLKEAHRVFFTSSWALGETARLYELDGNNFVNIGEGPLLDTGQDLTPAPPLKKQFLFVAIDFLGKGGAEICRAFGTFQSMHPDYELAIAGQQPPESFLRGKNIRYLGFINKSSPEGARQLGRLYQESSALLLITRKDIAPVVIAEAGILGCPTIASSISAIPEMVKDQVTGFVIGNNEREIVGAMLKIAEMREKDRVRMRENAKEFIGNNFSWDKTGVRMAGSIQE
jgi:glycosyltransferase involved in cell wall biosynthesis